MVKRPSCGRAGPQVSPEVMRPAGPRDLGCWARGRHLTWGSRKCGVLGRGHLGGACLSRLLCSLTDCGGWGGHPPLTV